MSFVVSSVMSFVVSLVAPFVNEIISLVLTVIFVRRNFLIHFPFRVRLRYNPFEFLTALWNASVCHTFSLPKANGECRSPNLN